MMTGDFSKSAALPRRQHAHRAGKDSLVPDLFVETHFVGSRLCSSRVVVIQHRRIIEASIGVLDVVVVEQFALLHDVLGTGHVTHVKAGLFVVKVLAHVDLIAVLILDHDVQTQGLQLLQHNAEGLGDARLRDRLALDDSLVGLDTALDVVGLDG